MLMAKPWGSLMELRGNFALASVIAGKDPSSVGFTTIGFSFVALLQQRTTAAIIDIGKDLNLFIALLFALKVNGS
jgi:hypothetical protein